MTATARKQLHFYGITDDIFIIEGITCIISPRNQDRSFRTEAIHILSRKGALMVYGRFSPDMACWLTGVAPVNPEAPVPDWPVSMTFMQGYGSRLSIEVPLDARVSVLRPSLDAGVLPKMEWG